MGLELRSYLKPPIRLLGIRQHLDDAYHDLFESARKQVDIIALTSENLIRVYGPRLRSKIENHPCDIRIMFLDVESELWACRLRDESDYTHKDIRRILSESTDYFRKLSEEIEQNTDIKSNLDGSLSVRCFDDIPYFAYFRADSKIIVGFYYSFTVGLKSHAILVDDKSSDLFRMLEKHFDALWNRNQKEIVNITTWGAYRNSEEDD